MSPAASSTRWCPTPEQLMILEEMYRGGIKTPNATQIQQITAHLSLYGKIQGKNVFYWFQNHKARDRQKLRRKLLCRQQQQQQHLPQVQMYPTHYHHPYHLVNPFQPSTSLGLQPFLHSDSPEWLSQKDEREVLQEASLQAMMNNKKDMVDTSRMTEIDNWTQMRGHSDMMSMMNPDPLCCNVSTNNMPPSPPHIRTLELFPLESKREKSPTDPSVSRARLP